MRAVALVLVMGACGSVADMKTPDARLPDSRGIDSPVDVPVVPAVTTAIGVDGISPFAAPNITFTKVLYSTETYDDGNEFDPTTNRFTAKVAGEYQICASLYIPGATFELDVYLNDAREKAFALGTDIASGCHSVRMAAGDHAEVWVYQSSGTTTSIADNSIWAWLTIRRMPMKVVTQATTAFDAATSTFTKVPYDSEIFDDLGAFDPTTNRFTAAAAGDVQVCASLDLGGLTRRAELDLYVNGTRRVGYAYNFAAPPGCHTLRLAAGDTVETWMYHSTGTTITVPPSVNWNWMTFQPQPATVYEGSITTFDLPNVAFVKVPYTSEVFDDNGQFDVGTNTFTAHTAGDYEVCASLDPASLNVRAELDIYKNGSRERGIVSSHGATGGHCRVIRLAANDQIAIYAYQDSGATVTVPANALWNWLQISKL